MKKKLASMVITTSFALIMEIPAFANSDKWSISEYDGRYLYGSVDHTMTAGTLTVSGKVWNNGNNENTAPFDKPSKITVTA